MLTIAPLQNRLSYPDTDLAGLRGANSEYAQFLLLIRRNLAPPYDEVGEYQIREDRSADEYRMRFAVPLGRRRVEIVDARWLRSTGELVLQPHPGAVVSHRVGQAWNETLARVYTTVEALRSVQAP